MPLTPFHFGPGILIKPLAKKFSLTAFIVSQIIIDLEPLWNILRKAPRLHGLFHTFLGALIPAFLTVMVVRNILKRVPVSVLLFSALIGVWSHVILDGIMHRDMTPFFPFSDANPFLGIIPLSFLYWGCVVSGVIGLILWLLFRNREGLDL